jgi:hypothetical protein
VNAKLKKSETIPSRVVIEEDEEFFFLKNTLRLQVWSLKEDEEFFF